MHCMFTTPSVDALPNMPNAPAKCATGCACARKREGASEPQHVASEPQHVVSAL